MSLPVLVREVRLVHPIGSSAWRRAKAVVTAIIVSGSVVVGWLCFQRPRYPMCFESKSDLTRLQVKEYADSAYLIWKQDHPDRTCPPRLGDLNEYTNRKSRGGLPDISDPWGHDMFMLCADHGLAVFSAGPDGLPYTPDDITSWE